MKMFSDTDIRFRKALLSDTKDLAELRKQQLLDEGYPEILDIQRDLETYFDNSLTDGSLICWVGESAAKIQATGAVCFYQLPPTFSNPSGKVAYITNMYTADQYRRRGIASMLLDKLIEEVRALNYPSVRLHASELGKGGYQKAGFSDVDGYMNKKL